MRLCHEGGCEALNDQEQVGALNHQGRWHHVSKILTPYDAARGEVCDGRSCSDDHCGDPPCGGDLSAPSSRRDFRQKHRHFEDKTRYCFPQMCH